MIEQPSLNFNFVIVSNYDCFLILLPPSDYAFSPPIPLLSAFLCLLSEKVSGFLLTLDVKRAYLQSIPPAPLFFSKLLFSQFGVLTASVHFYVVRCVSFNDVSVQKRLKHSAIPSRLFVFP